MIHVIFGQVKGDVWINDVHCVTTGLSQSVKAVLTAICQEIVFPEVIDALNHVQVCIMDIVNSTGFSKTDPSSIDLKNSSSKTINTVS